VFRFSREIRIWRRQCFVFNESDPSKALRESLSRICNVDLNFIGLTFLRFSGYANWGYPSPLIEMCVCSSEFNSFACGLRRFPHLIELQTINDRYNDSDEENRELHPITPSLPVRLICSVLLCIVGWYIGYRGRIAWDRRHFIRAVIGFALFVCFAGLAVHVFFYL
jgi:hypothetical protein